MIIVPAAHLAIVDLDTFTTVQSILSERARTFKKKAIRARPIGEGPRDKFLLSGRIRCSGCDLVMHTTTDLNGERRILCKAASAGIRCSIRWSFPLRALDRCAIDAVRDHVSGTYDSTYRGELEQALANQRRRIEIVLGNIDAQIKQADEKAAGLINFYIDEGRSQGQSRTLDRMKVLVEEAENRLDSLRRRRALLLSPMAVPGIEDAAMTKLGDFLDVLWDKSPFVAGTPEEMIVKKRFRDLVTKVVPSRPADGRIDVEITMLRPGFFRGRTQEVVRTFHLDSYLADPSTARRRDGIAERLAGGRDFACNDLEFQTLRPLIRNLYRLDETSQRSFVDALVLVLSADVTVARALSAHGLHSEDHVRRLFELRSDGEASRAFAKALSGLRPNAEVRIARLHIYPRRGRYLRHRMNGHAILDLDACSQETAPARWVLDDEQWETVSRCVADMDASFATGRLRSDLDAAFYLLRENAPWQKISFNRGNVSKRLNKLFEHPVFEMIVRELLLLEGKAEAASRPMTAIPKTRRHKREGSLARRRGLN